MMKQFENLTSRERVMVLVGLAVAGLSLVYLLAVNPLLSWRANAAASLAAAKSDYSLVERAAAQKPSQTDGGNVNRSVSVRNAIYQTAGNYSVTIAYVNSEADGRIAMNANSASGQGLYDWLAALERDYAIIPASADISRDTRNAEGGLSLQAIFERRSE